MVFTKHIEPMKNNSLLQKSNHVMEKAKDWCFFCAKFIINMFSDCQINVPQLLNPTHNVYNTVPRHAILSTIKFLEVMGNTSLGRNTMHGEEQAVDGLIFLMCQIDEHGN